MCQRESTPAPKGDSRSRTEFSEHQAWILHEDSGVEQVCSGDPLQGCGFGSPGNKQRGEPESRMVRAHYLGPETPLDTGFGRPSLPPVLGGGGSALRSPGLAMRPGAALTGWARGTARRACFLLIKQDGSCCLRHVRAIRIISVNTTPHGSYKQCGVLHFVPRRL